MAGLLAAAAMPLTAAALLVVGVVLGAEPGQAESFGWFSYAPMDADTGGARLVLLTTRMQAGLLLALAGLLLAAFWAGIRLERRRRRTTGGG